MLMVAIGWQLYALTGSALDLGLLGLAQFVPMLVLTLLVGHVADRYDNRTILLICQIGEAIAAGVLALGTVMGWLDPLAIYIVTALVGAGARVRDPDHGRDHSGAGAAAGGAGGDRLVRLGQPDRQIVGPMLGGLLYGLGPAAVYGTHDRALGVGACFISMIRMERAPRATEPMSLRSLLGGFRFVRRDRVILGTIALDMCAVFLARRRRCSRSSPATSCRPARGGSGCCARRPASAR